MLFIVCVIWIALWVGYAICTNCGYVFKENLKRFAHLWYITLFCCNNDTQNDQLINKLISRKWGGDIMYATTRRLTKLAGQTGIMMLQIILARSNMCKRSQCVKSPTPQITFIKPPSQMFRQLESYHVVITRFCTVFLYLHPHRNLTKIFYIRYIVLVWQWCTMQIQIKLCD